MRPKAAFGFMSCGRPDMCCLCLLSETGARPKAVRRRCGLAGCQEPGSSVSGVDYRRSFEMAAEQANERLVFPELRWREHVIWRGAGMSDADQALGAAQKAVQHFTPSITEDGDPQVTINQIDGSEQNFPLQLDLVGAFYEDKPAHQKSAQFISDLKPSAFPPSAAVGHVVVNGQTIWMSREPLNDEDEALEKARYALTKQCQPTCVTGGVRGWHPAATFSGWQPIAFVILERLDLCATPEGAWRQAARAIAEAEIVARPDWSDPIIDAHIGMD